MLVGAQPTEAMVAAAILQGGRGHSCEWWLSSCDHIKGSVHQVWGLCQAWSGLEQGGMKPVQGSPVSVTMQEAFGCAVANRFFQLLDDESDPLDFLHQTSSELGHKKKKEETPVKKAGTQKSNKKESQKDRKANTNTESPDLKPTPKQPVPKVTQNEKRGTEVERSERRTAFREFRPNVIEKPLEYSIENFEKEKQVRSWVSNQRGGTRGRGRGGFSRSVETENQRGKRDFDRHSGSDKTRIKAEDKRGGGGPHNWGSFKDAFSEAEPAPMENSEAMEPVDTTGEEQEVKMPDENIEDSAKEMSLDEWKCMQDQSRPKIEFNLRKPDSSVLSKAVVIHKSKFTDYSKENEEDYNSGIRKPVNDITSQLDINFGSLPRPGRGGRGGGRGRVKREEAFPHEVCHAHEFVFNADEDFPALM